jgi:hypothetical protein
MQWLGMQLWFTMLMVLEICLPHPAKIEKLLRLQLLRALAKKLLPAPACAQQDAQALSVQARALPEEAALAVEARAQEADTECDAWWLPGPYSHIFSCSDSDWPELFSCSADGYGYDEFQIPHV